MKTALIISIALLLIGTSYTIIPEKNNKSADRNKTASNPVVKIQSSDFDTFLKLFPDIKLPFKIDDIKFTENIVSGPDMAQYLIPYDEEIAQTETVKCLGKFLIEKRFHGVMFAFETQLSGAIIELFVFDLEGNFQSSVILGVDYRSWYQTAYVDEAYNIKTEAYFRQGDEGGEGTETTLYKIVNGIITLE